MKRILSICAAFCLLVAVVFVSGPAAPVAAAPEHSQQKELKIEVGKNENEYIEQAQGNVNNIWGDESMYRCMNAGQSATYRFNFPDSTYRFTIGSFWAFSTKQILLEVSADNQNWLTFASYDNDTGLDFSVELSSFTVHEDNVEAVLENNPDKLVYLRITAKENAGKMDYNCFNLKWDYDADQSDGALEPWRDPVTTRTGTIRYDAYPLHGDENQLKVWNDVMMKGDQAANLVNGTPYIADYNGADTAVEFDWVYMKVTQGHITYRVDLPDRACDFSLGSWAEFTNAVVLGSKDEGKTWYVIGDAAGAKHPLNTIHFPADTNAGTLPSCKDNIRWLLTGNPEKTIQIRLQSLDENSRLLYSNLNIDYTTYTGENTSADLPAGVPEGYEIPQAYVLPEEPDHGDTDYRDPNAAFYVSSAFGNNMVLQQNEPVDIFGFGECGAALRVQLKKAGEVIDEAAATVSADGSWSVSLEEQAGGFDPYVLTITDGVTTQTVENIVFGEVWVTGGQSNMEFKVRESKEYETWKKKERNPYIRLFLPSASTTSTLYQPLSEPKGRWRSADNWIYVSECTAIGYYYAEKLFAGLQVPVGIIDTAVGGTPIRTWIDRQTVDGSQAFKNYLEANGQYGTKENWVVTDARNTTPKYQSGLYNARIAPFSGLHAAGILWYQGEEDVGKQQTDALEMGIPLLVESWSKTFGCEEGELLPFIAVQLAPYSYYTAEKDLPEGNEKIARGVEKVTQSGGLAITIPIYDVSLDYTEAGGHPIHPWTKEPVAEKCAKAALGMVYGLYNIYSGPVLLSAERKESRITLTFDNVGDGLNKRGDTLQGFALIGQDGKLKPAAASITGKNTIVLTVEDGVETDTVFYAYTTQNTASNLYNQNGYLALPFRAAVTVIKDDDNEDDNQGDGKDDNQGDGSDPDDGKDDNQNTDSSGDGQAPESTPPSSGEASGVTGSDGGDSVKTGAASPIPVLLLAGASAAVLWMTMGKRKRTP